MSPKFDTPPPSPNSFSRPKPRAPKSPAHAAQIRLQNRRREYLERHPSYLQSLDHELADPLLYDSLIRKFQSPKEREAEGRTKGYSKVLEGSLLRGEARLESMTQSYDSNMRLDQTVEAPSGFTTPLRPTESAFASLNTDLGPPPSTKEEGRERWDAYLTNRFVHGKDEDFDYASVDDNEDYDTLERRDDEDAWFDDEEPSWTGSDQPDEADPGSPRKEGETGVQGF